MDEVERRRAEIARLRERNRERGLGKAPAPLRVRTTTQQKPGGCGGCGKK